jgi:L-fuculose-phosphate aldolase
VEAKRAEILRDLQQAATLLDRRGCLPATDGNFSVRLDASTVLLTRSGAEKRALQDDDVVAVPLNEEYPRGASSEWLMHRALYQARESVQCVLHVHAPYLNSFAAAHSVPNVNLLAEAALLIQEIAWVPFALPGTPDLGESLIQCSRTAAVYVLANHGVVAVGQNVREALYRLERAEFLAQVEIQARLLGKVRPLSSSDIENMKAAYVRRPA